MEKYQVVRQAFKLRRENQEIYKGFGFRHLSDATNYFVHPWNQSINNTTTLAQPIGEAMALNYELRKRYEKEDYANYGNRYVLSVNDRIIGGYLNVTQEHRDAKLFSPHISKVEFLCNYKNQEIVVNGFNSIGEFVELNDYEINMLSNLALFTTYSFGTMKYEDQLNPESELELILMDQYQLLLRPRADLFVKVHETYYQNHKSIYQEVSVNQEMDFSKHALDEGEYDYQLHVQKSIEETRKPEQVLQFTGFDEMYIPKLRDGYEKHEHFDSIGNAIVEGDVLSVLFYGPAGTGKTIACQMLCEQMKLPLLATINCTENLDEFVLGKFIPIDDKIIFRESEVTKAIRNGAVVFEEINFV